MVIMIYLKEIYELTYDLLQDKQTQIRPTSFVLQMCWMNAFIMLPSE